jgi:aminoglycoside 2''-phosphotransferase
MTSHVDRIRAAFPDLIIDAIKQDQFGLVNDVLIVNDARVFRFPKNEWARTMQARELRVLDLLAPRLDLPVPQVDYRSDEMISYPLIPGQPLAWHDLHVLPDAAQDRLARTLAVFFRQMHETPFPAALPPSDADRTRDERLAQHAAVQEKIVPLLWPDQKAWIERLYAPLLDDPHFLDHTPSLMNGDVGSYHILYDAEKQAINGIIDFGTAGVGDPAVDFGVMINTYGESFVRRMEPHYPSLPNLIERARFIAGQVELEWVLKGLRSNDPMWYTVHLGRARDVKPIGVGW